MATETAGEYEKSDEGASSVTVDSNMDAEAAEESEDGSFWRGWVFLICLGMWDWIGMDCLH